MRSAVERRYCSRREEEESGRERECGRESEEREKKREKRRERSDKRDHRTNGKSPLSFFVSFYLHALAAACRPAHRSRFPSAAARCPSCGPSREEERQSRRSFLSFSFVCLLLSLSLSFFLSHTHTLIHTLSSPHPPSPRHVPQVEPLAVDTQLPGPAPSPSPSAAAAALPRPSRTLRFFRPRFFAGCCCCCGAPPSPCDAIVPRLLNGARRLANSDKNCPCHLTFGRRPAAVRGAFSPAMATSLPRGGALQCGGGRLLASCAAEAAATQLRPRGGQLSVSVPALVFFSFSFFSSLTGAPLSFSIFSLSATLYLPLFLSVSLAVLSAVGRRRRQRQRETAQAASRKSISLSLFLSSFLLCFFEWRPLPPLLFFSEL